MSRQILPAPRSAVIRFGIVKSNRPLAGRIKVEIKDQDRVVTRWIPTPHRGTLKNKHYHHIPKNSQVCLLMDDKLEDGFVLDALYSDPDPVPEDPVYGKPSDDSLTGVYYSEQENGSDWDGVERFKRGENNRLTYAKNGTLVRNATLQVWHFDDKNAIHDIADVLVHIKAPLICLDGNVQVTGSMIVAGYVEDEAGTVTCGTFGGGGGGNEEFQTRMQQWLAKITASSGAPGTGQVWKYKINGSWTQMVTHHATSDMEVIAYLRCLGATEIIRVNMQDVGSGEGAHFSGGVCEIDRYFP